MGHAPYNVLCSVFTGPNGSPPNTLKGQFSCREVLNPFFVWNDSFMIFSDRYVIMDSSVPVAGLTSGGGQIITIDFTRADRIVIPGTPARTLVVLHKVQCQYQTGHIYYRYYVARAGFGPF